MRAAAQIAHTKAAVAPATPQLVAQQPKPQRRATRAAVGHDIRHLRVRATSEEARPWTGGVVLPARERSDMESMFGRDFGHVRLHTDTAAAASARALRARAFTVGRHIVFGAGRYAPDTLAGRRLLAHELAHVAQHDGTSEANGARLEPRDAVRGRAEAEARRAAAAVPAAHSGPISTRVPPGTILRQGDEEAAATPSSEEESPGFWGTIGGGLMGEFNEDPGFAMIGVDVGVSLIPILDQASDLRDVIAHLYYLIVRRQYDRFMRWLGLVFTLIGLIPEVGSAIKGASKFVIRGVEVVISHLGDLLRPLTRLFPDIIDLGRLRGYVARNWTSLVAQGMAAWNRTAARVTRIVSMIPSFVGGRLRMLREGWANIMELAPRKLADAFAWVRQKWDEVLEAVERRLSPARATPDPAPRPVQVYAGGELRTVTGTPEVIRGPRSGATPVASATPTPPRRPPARTETPAESTREDIGDVIREETAHPGRSLTDTAGHTADEGASLADEVVSELGGRVDRLERHHSVFVYVLRAIESRRAGRAAREVTGAGGEGFRQIVDDLFPQALVTMDRMTHNALHRALNDTLDEMLEPQRVIDLIARRGAVEGTGAGRRVVERGGASAMMRRMQDVTEHELVDIVEEAYRRVFREHPGLLSDEMIEETLRAIERVRQAL